ncbi:aa3-type cytochrome c oxidase subunit IV [Erythrobacter sp. SDW2]|nr:aa3-type cytochrome c oxidase subunit IV [Erythrobacter sp. SDW2]UIP06388.1 aa3-type cytochrome c oxidase subunit IV [Erythrobacter sp. SDW2]
MAANDMKSAEKTYASFISMVKISLPTIALITLVVVVLIAE